MIIILLLIKTIRGKSSRVKLETIWIMPLLIIVSTAEDIFRTSNVTIVDGFIFLLFTGIGLIFGILRSKFLRFENDEQTGKVVYYNSIISLGIMIVIMLVKFYIRRNVTDLIGGINPLIISDALLCMTCSTIVTRKVYIVMKYTSIKKIYRKN
ncbi:hypothetical protein ACJDT4_03850 [Clostridium neuense]|uniref:DUF1453 domain-containing protein n=1 Tax=Clostridium neuense TaxID=1728934 RepID=A0ABW8TD17_9CLOT